MRINPLIAPSPDLAAAPPDNQLARRPVSGDRRPGEQRRSLWLAAWCLLVLLANGLALYPGDPVLATAGGLLALVFLPGLALAGCLSRRDWRPGLAELALLATAAGAAWLTLVALGAVLLGLRPALLLLTFADAVALGLPLFFAARGAAPLIRPSLSGAELLRIGLILAVAVPLRFVGLGYTEFQGDETEVILRALGLVQGLPNVLFYHGKGPAELLVTAVFYGLSGHLTEASARLPFALFNIVAILGLAALVTRWFGGAAGLAAGLLLAVNGYFVAFAHLAQYQSLVFLFSVAAIFCAEHYRALRAAQGRWVISAGLMIGVGTLAHYDALFAGPLVGALVAMGIGRARPAWRRAVPALLLAAAGMAIGPLLFFGPYLSSPLFELATDRLAGRIGDAFPRNNLPTIVPALSLYLSGYYAFALLGLALVGLAVGLLRPPTATGPIASSTGRRLVAAIALWALLPAFAYIAVVRKPGTHIHVALEGLVVLAAIGIGAIGFSRRHGGRIGRTALAAIGLLALGPVLAYQGTFFLVNEPEVVRAGLATRYPLYWRLGEAVPRKERFGFPYQAGWKAMGVLFADGTLAGTYDSNENPQITHWYTRDAWRCTAEPRYYLIAEGVQDEIEPPRAKIAQEYSLVADVTVQGRPKLHVYDRRPDGSQQPAVYAAEELGPRFDRELSGHSLDPGSWARGRVASQYEAVDADFGEVRLLGFRLYPENAQPGGVVRLDLFWLPRVDGGGHEAAVRLGRDEAIGNGRGPGCDHGRSWEEWRAGQPFIQRHSIPIAQRAAAGSYPLLVGMDSAARQGPLPIIGGAGLGDTSVEITRLDVGRR